MVDKWSIKPTLADKLADILVFMSGTSSATTGMIVLQFGSAPTTAKRYLRQLVDFGCLKSCGGNKNRSYKLKSKGDK